MNRKGLTLLELVIVTSILAALAGLVVPQFLAIHESAARSVCLSSLSEIQAATLQYWSDTKTIPLDGITTSAVEADRFRIEWLYRSPVTNTSSRQFNPSSRIGWNGPYLQNRIQSDSGLTPLQLDPWNHSIVFQDVDSSSAIRDVRIVSAGPDGIVNLPAHLATAAITPIDQGDDLYVSLTLR